jgi:hypothetical protein
MQEFNKWLREVKGISTINVEDMEKLHPEFLEWQKSNNSTINKVSESDIIKVDEQ